MNHYFQATKRNMKEREDERIHDVDMIDGQMLWYIMHHMPRARRRVRQMRYTVEVVQSNTLVFRHPVTSDKHLWSGT